jgi:hypothetical protein
MSVRRNSSRTNVNSAYNTAAVQTSNSKTIAPDTAVLRETSGGSFAPTITAVAITNSDYNIIDDTNVSTGGGYIRITGTGFVSGCVVYIGGVAALSTTLLNSTQVNVQINATSSNTLHVYLVNPDGSAAIYLSGITFSGVPSWVTDPTISGLVNEVAFSIGLSATSNSTVAYSLTAGSVLPPGTTLTSAGVFSGTVSGLSAETTYSFSVTATDLELQDTPRTFSVTVAIGDPYFYLTPVLLNGEANVWIRDSSTNNFLPTIGGDTRPTAFTPYNAYWSTLFAAGNYLTVSGNSNLAFGTGDFIIEFFIYFTSVASAQNIYDARPASTNGAYPVIYLDNTTGKIIYYVNTAARITSDVVVLANQWYHVVVSRVSSVTRMFINGTQQTTTYSDTNTYLNGASRPIIGASSDLVSPVVGYISNLRALNGTGTTSPTVPTAPLTAIANTQLLTLQDNRFKDNSTNAYAITVTGATATKSFAPFVETDLITGSAYFDGTTDFLTIADNAALELGAGDFCVELWIHPTTISGTGTIIDKRSGTYGPLLFWRFGATLQLYMSSNNSSWNLANGVTVGTVTANQWYHIAIYRVGSTIYSAFNGTVSTVTASGSATPHNNAGAWYFGTGTNGSSDPYTGYIADMRFVIGSGVYTGSNFTPPATSLTAITNTQLLTLQYRRGDNNHRFVEESGVRALTTRTGNPSQGSFSPFSPAGWSNYFNGSTDFFTWTGTAVGAGAFTVEFWFYNTSDYSASRSPIGVISTSGYNNALDVRIANSTTINVSQYNVANNNFTVPTMASNTWYHVAITRNSSNQLTVFLNGARSTTGAVSISTNFSGLTSSIGRIDQSNVGAWFGYISNVRIVTGTNVYDPTQSTITVPTSSLTAISGTAFLSCQNNRFKDNSTNAYTITRAGSAAIQAFSPLRGSGTYSPAIHGGSAYFDGSGDYVYIANNAVMTLGTNDHCIELWMYPNGAQNQYTSVWYYSVGSASGATNTYYFSIGSDSGGGISVLGGPLSGVWAVTLGGLGSTEYTAVLNTWTHVVLTRRGSAYRLFLNGVLKAYTTYAGSIIAQGGSFSIGWDGANATTYYKGWISDFKVINGSIPTAYQTSSTTTGTTIFTPPTSVPTFESNTAMAMNFTNGGIVDASARNVMETAGTAKISNVASKFGIGSINFGTRTDYLAIPSTPTIAILGGDFTLEAWVYPTDISVSQTWGIIDARQSAGSANAWIWRLDSYSSGWLLNFYTGTNYSSTGRVQANVWTHVAVVRSGTTLTFYINGSASGTATVSGVITGTATTNPIFIGTKDTGSGATYGTVGYIDDLRITNGFARTITLPTSTFLTK